jgi:hypothetical protein
MSEISWRDHIPKLAIGVVVIVTSYFVLQSLKRDVDHEEIPIENEEEKEIKAKSRKTSSR